MNHLASTLRFLKPLTTRLHIVLVLMVVASLSLGMAFQPASDSPSVLSTATPSPSSHAGSTSATRHAYGMMSSAPAAAPSAAANANSASSGDNEGAAPASLPPSGSAAYGNQSTPPAQLGDPTDPPLSNPTPSQICIQCPEGANDGQEYACPDYCAQPLPPAGDRTGCGSCGGGYRELQTMCPMDCMY